MNCEQRMDEMQRFVDHDLTQAEEESLLAHVEQCPDCAASFEQLQRLSAELSLLPMVSPPFSIVDSILPRLAELDAQHAAINVANLPTANQRKQTFFPWKIGAGFVAAAVIFSLVIVNLAPNSSKDASEMSSKMSSEKVQSAAASDQISKADSGAGLEKMQDKEALRTPKLESVLGLEEQTSPVHEKSLDQFGGEPAAGTSSKTPEAPDLTGTLTTSTKSAPAPAPPAPAPAPPAPAPAATSAPTGASAVSPIAGEKDTLDITFNQSVSNKTIENPSLASEDGNFIAVIQQQTVLIQTPDGNRSFTSSVQWKNLDVISLLKWQDNQQLTYEVKAEDGTVKRYVIDAIQKTELEQKN